MPNAPGIAAVRHLRTDRKCLLRDLLLNNIRAIRNPKTGPLLRGNPGNSNSAFAVFLPYNVYLTRDLAPQVIDFIGVP
jgi:hypothetical protein